MKIPIRATQNKQKGRQFDMPDIEQRLFSVYKTRQTIYKSTTSTK